MPKNVWWKCKTCGNEWKSVVYVRIKGDVVMKETKYHLYLRTCLVSSQPSGPVIK
ncbi:zinc-ribbon domain-containing protein [Acutalibacter muris]|uniref:zinc-ribbon domain-containing protein n=1 Tax=Acutalibacter muris TaxID=1796620 RepID=UPI001F16BEB1|nr:zinc-ribbon domain-containing protein [Acutalibacter muris]